MNDKKVIIGMVILTISIIIGGLFFALKMNDSIAASEPNPKAKAFAAETFYNWGEVLMKDGNLEKEFGIKSAGEENLELFNVTTSCACTTAQLFLGEDASPVFGMHTKSDYVLKIPAGKIAKLRVIFDPAFHGPSGIGNIEREINVETNDPENSTLSFNLKAVVKN